MNTKLLKQSQHDSTTVNWTIVIPNLQIYTNVIGTVGHLTVLRIHLFSISLNSMTNYIIKQIPLYKSGTYLIIINTFFLKVLIDILFNFNINIYDTIAYCI
jgi:hypothetical protein